MPGTVRGIACGADPAAPDEGMLSGKRGRHHSLANRLEDLRLAEIRNEQTEGQRAGGAFHERAGPRTALHQSAVLQVANRASYRDARHTEPVHELRFARQTIAALPMSGLNLATEDGVHPSMLEAAIGGYRHRNLLYQSYIGSYECTSKVLQFVQTIAKFVA